MWNQGVIHLQRPIGTRVYRLRPGWYSLCAWIKQDKTTPRQSDQAPAVSLKLSNRNYYRDKQRNEFTRKFTVMSTDTWQQVGWSFEIKHPVRDLFHVEIIPGKFDAPILVEAVSLTPGKAMPTVMHPAADIEAGFWIPEETRIYVDGEKRVVILRVRNHGPTRKARVEWQLFNHHEDLVDKGAFDQEWSASSTTQKRIPMA